MLAVLPFEPLSPGQEYFAQGISEEILNFLAAQPRIKVLGRVSGDMLQRQGDVLASARKLGVETLFDGSVRADAAQLLVIVRLIRTSDGTQVWSQRFQRKLASGIGDRQPSETAPEVYQRYLAARSLTRERRPVTLDNADKLLREAIALDPAYPPPTPSCRK